MTVTNEGVVVQKYVKLGDVVGSQYVVISGLNEGDRVVTIGQQKLQNGQQVNVSETNAPDYAPTTPKAAEKTTQTNEGNK